MCNFIRQRRSSEFRKLRQRTRRTGAIISLELLIALPILVAVSIGATQAGLLLKNKQQLTLACRVGAEEASQTVALTETSANDPVPDNILEAIDNQLASSNIAFCRVFLEHNVGGSQVVLSSDGPDSCDCQPPPRLSDPPPRQYVRLTLCVKLEQLMPSSLTLFGASPAGEKIARCSSVYRYELNRN